MITLTVASASEFPNRTFTLNLSIASTGGDQCAAVQFNLNYGGDLVLNSVALGAASVAAGKSLAQAGSLIVVYSATQSVIGNGVLVTLTFTLDAHPSSLSLPITLTAIVASDINANPLITGSVPGTITVAVPTLACPVTNTVQVGQPYSSGLIVGGNGTPPYTFAILS